MRFCSRHDNGAADLKSVLSAAELNRRRRAFPDSFTENRKDPQPLCIRDVETNVAIIREARSYRRLGGTGAQVARGRCNA